MNTAQLFSDLREFTEPRLLASAQLLSLTHTRFYYPSIRPQATIFWREVRRQAWVEFTSGWSYFHFY